MNIGFYLLDIYQNNLLQQSVLKNINNICNKRPYDNIVVFNNNFNTIDNDKKYYLLSPNHAKYFEGILFLFDSQSALLTKTFPGPSKQVIYMQEPHWTQNYAVPFTVWYNIYMDNRFEFIAGTPEVSTLLNICWKPALKTVENFNAEEIDDVIRQL